MTGHQIIHKVRMTRARAPRIRSSASAESIASRTVRPEAAVLTADLVRSVSGALDVAGRYPEVLRRIAQQEYDWQPIAAMLARTLHGAEEDSIMVP